jgi:phenylpropionate dioxygenase-like ring-hydroxylating dioxygenase large terminal subunit
MVMSAEVMNAVKERAEAEAVRQSYPPEFPVLPTVPAGRYVDAGFAKLEAELVFSRSWLFVAHADQLRNSGDYILLDQLDKPIMLIRGADNTVRAFYNTCRHRGAALVKESQGNVGRRLTCPFHAWTYSLDGKLVGYPEALNFSDLDRDCHGLAELRCESWGPLVFINLDANARPLAAFLGSVGEDLSDFAELDGRLHLVDRTVRHVPVNWKLPVDANLESYHVNYVHRISAGRTLQQSGTGIQLLSNGHSRMLVPYRDGIDGAALSPFPEVFQSLGDLPFCGTFSYHVFPNLSIVFAGSGFVFLITNWPTGPSTSAYNVHWCSSRAGDDEANRKINDTVIAALSEVLFEDLEVLPGQQRSIDAGTLESLRLGYQERRIYYLHEAIDRAIGIDQVPESLRVPQLLGPFVQE